MAPEVSDGKYNHKADVFSCGWIIYRMLTGKFPNDATWKPDFSTTNSSTASSRDLVNKMVQAEPQRRIDIPRFLTHTWR